MGPLAYPCWQAARAAADGAERLANGSREEAAAASAAERAAEAAVVEAREALVRMQQQLSQAVSAVVGQIVDANTDRMQTLIGCPHIACQPRTWSP